jgi:hypothetical protein
MVAIGDVFSIVGTLVGICVTSWALIMGAALLFQGSAYRAKTAYQTTPYKGLFLGIGVTLLIGVASFLLLAIPLPLVKMAGTMGLLSLMSLAALGASGVAMVVADRICALDPGVSRYTAMIRATAIMSIAGVFPVLGWFLVGPVLILASVGYGLKAVFQQATALAGASTAPRA